MAKNGVFTNRDVVEHVMKKNKGMKKTQARKVVGDVFDGLKWGIKKNEKVRISGFGIYTKRRIPAKKGGKRMFMPALGREVVTKPKPAMTKIRFRAAKDLKH